MQPAHTEFRSRRTFGSLDGLRALSIVAVVWHHTHPGFAWAVSRRGFLGVDLFFVISGFLIVSLLLRERDRCGEIRLGAFYARRSLRIFPLNYAVALGVTALALATGANTAPALVQDLPFVLTYTGNWVPMASMLSITWSLAAEEQFYLVWPFVERHLARHARTVLGVSLLVSAGIALAHAHLGWFAGVPAFLVETTFTPILLGVALAHGLHVPGGFARLAPLLGPRWSAPLALAVLLVLGSVPSPDISGVLRVSIQVCCAWLVGACVIREDHGAATALRWRVLARIGVVSYGIYLLQYVAMDIARRLLQRVESGSTELLFVLTMLLSWLAAEISFRTFERFFLRLKERFAR